MSKVLKAAAGCLAGALLSFSATVYAADEVGYPKQPLKVVVPFTAGSATDVIARAIGDRLAKQAGQPVIIDNRPGAGGTIGASQVAASAGDGYTLLVHSAGHVANAALYPTLKYDTVKDFRPVAMLATLPNVLVVSPKKGFRHVGDLVERARAGAGKMAYGSAGNGSATHINAEKFRVAAKLDAMHVPFKGTPEALTSVVAGEIDWFFAPLVSALPLIKDGKLQALAVGAPARSALLPGVPTTVEAGYPGSEYNFWVGLFAPAKTPEPVVQALVRQVDKALGQPDVRERYQTLGAELPNVPATQFQRFVETEVAATASLIRTAGVKLN